MKTIILSDELISKRVELLKKELANRESAKRLIKDLLKIKS